MSATVTKKQYQITKILGPSGGENGCYGVGVGAVKMNSVVNEKIISVVNGSSIGVRVFRNLPSFGGKELTETFTIETPTGYTTLNNKFHSVANTDKDLLARELIALGVLDVPKDIINQVIPPQSIVG